MPVRKESMYQYQRASLACARRDTTSVLGRRCIGRRRWHRRRQEELAIGDTGNNPYAKNSLETLRLKLVKVA